MSNFFLQILIIIKSIPRCIKKINFKFALTSILLLIVGWYYILCQEIQTSDRTISINKVAGEDSIYALDINLGLNCSAFNNHPKYGVAQNKIGILAKAQNNNANILLNNTFSEYRAKFSKLHPDSSINSIDVIYSVKYESTSPYYAIFHSYENKSSHKLNTFRRIGVFPYFHAQKYNYRNNLSDCDTITIHNMLGYDSILTQDVYISLSNYKSLYIWQPTDISQMYHNIKINLNNLSYTPKDSTITLSFDFVGNTIFSAMNPSPDKIDMGKITFYSAEKIEQICKYGLKFHTEFSDNKNLQSSKSFLITTILSILIAYWCAIVGKFIHVFSARRKREKQKANSPQS